MTAYTLVIPGKIEPLNTLARSRQEALEVFARELGHEVTDVDDGLGAPDYLLDEWETGLHWINPTIPIYQVRR